MHLRRRRFMGLTGAGLVGTACATTRSDISPSAAPAGLRGEAKWEAVRAEFDQDPEYANFTGFLLAPHPRRVREAIAKYRQALDRNPAL